MKHFFTLFSCLFISGVSYTQPTYQKYFGVKGNNDFECSTMIPFEDGSVVALSQSIFNKHLDKWDIGFVKFDPAGNVLIEKKIFTDYGSGDAKGIATSDGGYMLFLAQKELKNTLQPRWGVSLFKLNNKAEVEWAKYYNSDLLNHIISGSIIESKSGDYIVQYSFANDIYINNKMGIMKISKTGDIIWKTTLQPSYNHYSEYYGTSLLEGADGKIFVGGYLACEDCFLYYASTIMQLNANGKLEKARVFSSSYFEGFPLYKLFLINNQLIVYGGYTFTLDQDLPRFVLGTLTDFRNFFYRKYTNLPPQQIGRYCYFKNGSIIGVWREYYGSEYGYDIGVNKYDSLSRICPNYIPVEINTHTSGRYYQLKKLSVARLTDSMTVTDINVYDSIVDFVRTICAGDVPPALTSKLSAQKNISKIALYPNPADNILHILNLNPEEKYQLTIMDNLGKVFKQTSIENVSVYDIHLSGLKAGVYYLKSQSNKSNGSYIFIKK
ncbi:MAG: T9SS type A sorting domain-containing protein [Bacteroidetes bacterium]|nr:T9SS type A sorting domain-containing protein [Bacteroidota bacterium]